MTASEICFDQEPRMSFVDLIGVLVSAKRGDALPQTIVSKPTIPVDLLEEVNEPRRDSGAGSDEVRSGENVRLCRDWRNHNCGLELGIGEQICPGYRYFAHYAASASQTLFVDSSCSI